LPRIKTDLLEIFLATANGSLSQINLEIDTQTAACVMIVSGGYPGEYEKSKLISGFGDVNKSLIFHAGTSFKDGNIVTSGGRVIAVTSQSDTISSAISKSLESAFKIKFENCYFRKDIGKDLM
ncbi:MAG: phosphoribosylglycinamide synthetase C domain-containing protein, partial [Bacteroidales bacterium]